MKTIILLLLLSTSTLYAQDYSNLFNSLDSIQKTQAVDHLRKIKKLINYEIIKSGIKVKEKEFIKGVFFIDEQGKLSIVVIDENSKKYETIISKVISNSPLFNCTKYFNEYTSFKFKLNEISDLDNYYDKLMEEKEINPQAFSELNTYPAFKNHKFLDNKEKALELFFNSMSKHIKENLKYPEKAMEDNIQGKTNVYFLISMEGLINEIYAFNAHPLLQLEGIRIIEILPKLIPASVDGENKNVFYSQPLTFKLQ